ncbi:MAG: uridine kinase [Lachnospiraceae bacterium]|nr:uridine kinase [Lachnospiraceae bacterium]
MKTDYLQPLIERIEYILQSKDRVIVAIDGCAASGKTTASKYLGDYFDGNVIHMDDFFLPFSMRTEERMALPAGNIHYERLTEEICKPLSEGREFTYTAYDCSTGGYKESRQMQPKKVTIFEGAYCMYPGKIPYDVSVFFKSREAVQYERVLKRNGPEKLEAFKNRFIPMENKYIQTFQIAETAEFFFDTSDFF